MDAIINFIIQLVSGLGAGNATGAALKEKSMGPLGNSIAGIAGGGLGGLVVTLIEKFATSGVAATSNLDFGSIIGSILGGGIGGSVLTLIATYVKRALENKKS